MKALARRLAFRYLFTRHEQLVILAGLRKADAYQEKYPWASECSGALDLHNELRAAR